MIRSRYVHSVLFLLLLAYLPNAYCNDDIIPMLELPSLAEWKENSFVGNTRYSVVNLDEKPALKAVSDNSASGLVREITVDLTKTPYLNWSWMIENTLNGNDETKQSGDDYPARITDAEACQFPFQGGDIGKRMPPGRRANRAGQVPVKIKKHGPGNVLPGISHATRCRIEKIKTAVDDDQIRVAQEVVELIRDY